MKIPVGAVIVSAFAVLWTAAGARGLGRRWFVFLLAASILISAGIVIAAGHIQPPHPIAFNAKAYNVSVAVEAVLIFCAIVFLRRAGRKDLLLPVISFIVGLHFFGMVWALDSNLYWWIGGAMCLLSLLALMFLPRSYRMPTVGFGCAVILWFAAVAAFF
jgi:hypothetical protein